MKKCPYCAKGINDDALKCKHCGSSLIGGKNIHSSISTNSQPSKKTDPKTIIGAIFLVVVFLFIFGFCSSIGSKSGSSSTKPTTNYVATGDRGYINLDGYAAVTKDDYDLMASYITKNNNLGLAEMLIDGKAFKIKKGETVNVIDRKLSIAKVSLMDGETGWLPVEFITKK